MNLKHTALLTACVLTAFVGGFSIARAADKQVAIDRLPGGVQATIQKHLDGGTVREVESSKHDGKTIYEIEIVNANGTYALLVAQSGQLLEIEHEIQTADLPDEVLAAIAAAYPGATLKEAEAIQEYSFEVELDQGGKEIEVHVSPGGEIFHADPDEDDHDEHEVD